ncbi:TapB family protein [Hymenobacter persicinus]|uniref:DUF3108 domain-containing protein n=1 Tax=Hymenobacter persicinus TaxID=2025506 RepID=A0A4V1ZAV9_9BACT|nr:hypothetical protein [Hymenobacter persicinus]RYU80495.1 hypothetical protein EWM57_08360 [Hymenobacter persicinus]
MKLPALLALPLLALAARAQTTPPSPDTATTVASAPEPAVETACAHPFGLYDNMELVYRLTNGASKPTGELRYRVVRLGSELNKKKTRTTTTVLLKSGLYDVKNRLLHQQDLTFRCSRDTTFTDGLTQFNPESLKSFRERIFDFAPINIAWPNRPTIGSRLPDGGSVVQVRSSAVDIAKVSTLAQKRRVVSGPEAVKTPAGTFQCYKVESERESSTKARADVAFRTTVRVIDYYAPAVGVVKTEIFGKNGKLAETRTLAAISKGK